MIEVRRLFAERPPMDYRLSEAIRQLDVRGVFGGERERDRLVINLEVMPPDQTNTERALRLDPKTGQLDRWSLLAIKSSRSQQTERLCQLFASKLQQKPKSA